MSVCVFVCMFLYIKIWQAIYNKAFFFPLKFWLSKRE